MKEIHSYSTTLHSTTTIFNSENWEDIVLSLESKYSKICWIIDSKIKSRSEFNNLENKLELNSGELSKSLETYLLLQQFLAKKYIDRSSLIVAIGGGSISDLVGYVASTYLRGIDLAIIPTTLLSLIDASMGGKNGINFEGIKNQIGTIYQPKFIYNYTSFFDSLPETEIADGFAEIIKYGLIGNESLYQFISNYKLSDFKSNSDFRTEIIEQCMIQKSKIVEEDTFETGLRRILNFGHTLGHAIESFYGLSHGKSIALGSLFAVKLSEKINHLSPNIYINLQTLYQKYNLPIRLENFDTELLFQKLCHDKKVDSGEIHFVLLNKIGEAKAQKIELVKLKSWIEIAKNEAWI